MWKYFKRCFVVVPRFAGFVSPLSVYLLLVPFWLDPFGKVRLCASLWFCPALRFTSLRSCSLQSGLLTKYLHL